MANTMLHKSLTIEIKNPYPVITEDEQYYTCPIYTDIMKCLVSKGHHSCLSGGLFPVQGHTDYALDSYFNIGNAMKYTALLQLKLSAKTQSLNLAPVTTLCP